MTKTKAQPKGAETGRPDDDLRYTQALAAILSTSTYEEAAKVLGIGVRTLNEWRRSDEFQALMRETRRAAITEVASGFAVLAKKARARLEAVLDDEKATHAEVTAVARVVTERARDFAGDDDVAEQIAELTALVKEKKESAK